MQVAVVLFLLLAAYACVDRVLRGGGLSSLPYGARWTVAVVLALVSPLWTWRVVVGGDELAWVAGSIACLLAWNASTRDADPVTPGPGSLARVGLMLAAIGSFGSPALLVLTAALLSGRFHFWQHHAAFPMRVLQALTAYVLFASALAGKLPLPGVGLPEQTAVAALCLLLATMLVSHYVITALAKALLGPRPWSWVLHNRLHYLAASAYSWGWARFVPWHRYRRVIQGVRRLERPLQGFIFSLELLVPLALLDQRLAVGFSLAFAGFHLGVFALSGLFFWDWVLTDLVLALWIARLPPEAAHLAFGFSPLLLGCFVLGVFPLRHRLWKPMPLGWYDSPFTQRVHWQVTGASGKTYGLYNDFMCPHERLYGKVHGAFAVPHGVMTYHLGEVWKLELRDALVAAGPDLARLHTVRERFGIYPQSKPLTERHRRYLSAYFAKLNAGARKFALPRWAAWLKAPGDQLFYWGELEPYRRQELVRSVRLVYREEFFDGQELRRLVDEEILGFSIPEVAPKAAPEMAPREMDDYLLELAAGRLIELPGFKQGYLKADDQAKAPA